MDYRQYIVPLREYALNYVKRGWYPIPQCWPDPRGKCGCGMGRRHQGSEGKAPFLKGYLKMRMSERDVRYWWGRYPKANIALLLDPSDLIVVDLDSDEAVAEAERKGIPETSRVVTRKGYHLYFRRPDDFPLVRVLQTGDSGAIDLLSKGPITAAPSRHRSGHLYYFETVVDELPPPPKWVEDLCPPPGWVLPPGQVARLATAKERQAKTGRVEAYAELEVVKQALRYLDPDVYKNWIQVGMALRVWDDNGNGSGRGLECWDEWSQGSAKYPGYKQLAYKYNSFSKHGVTLGTLFGLAAKNGFVYPTKEERERPKYVRRGAFTNTSSPLTKHLRSSTQEE